MLIGIDASRATLAHRTGTETYSLRLIVVRDSRHPVPAALEQILEVVR